MEKSKEKQGLNIGVRSFLTAILVIFFLMVVTYVLTLFVPGGCYPRIEDANGNFIIDTQGAFSYIEGGISFVEWIFSPVLVLDASGSGTLIAVIVFLFVIGGVFNALECCGLMKYMLDKLVFHFEKIRYRLMAMIILFFMTLGALIGSFEECVPLVPIVVALSIHLGWDALTGVAMSLLAVGCGFAAGICNPFTVGVAQQLAGLPMFSGVWLRVIAFVLIYWLLFGFVYFYAKKIEKPQTAENKVTAFSSALKMDRALKWFCLILGIGIAAVLCSGFIPVLQDITMIIVAVMFLLAGIVSTIVSGMGGMVLTRTIIVGIKNIFPAVIMILMASSIKYTLEQAHVLDTILHTAVMAAESMPRWVVILFIYGIVLLLNFFIPSGSAKAFMIMPLLVPMAHVFDISAQLCVLAFAFGDGFSNVLYPTNPALLISIGLVKVKYTDWLKWSWRFQVANLCLTSVLLLLGLFVGY